MTSAPTKAGRQPAVPFKLDLPRENRRHTEADRYVANVFWVAGYSAGTIARLLGMRRSQALHLVQKSDLISRSTATEQKRRMLLMDLKAIRYEDGVPLDGGRLNGFDWQPIALDGRKRRGHAGLKAVAP